MSRQGSHAARIIRAEKTGRRSSRSRPRRAPAGGSGIAADPELLDPVDENMPGNAQVGGRLRNVAALEPQRALDHLLLQVDERKPLRREGGPFIDPLVAR